MGAEVPAALTFACKVVARTRPQQISVQWPPQPKPRLLGSQCGETTTLMGTCSVNKYWCNHAITARRNMTRLLSAETKNDGISIVMAADCSYVVGKLGLAFTAYTVQFAFPYTTDPSRPQGGNS